MAVIAVGSFFLGVAIGIFTMAICVTATREDKKREDNSQE